MKKAQVAMEFLMTYGWALLVVLTVIAALAYFGVLSPDAFIPERCQLQAGLNCRDKVVDAGANEILINFQNSKGDPILITNVSAVNTDLGIVCRREYTGLWAPGKHGLYVENGEAVTLTLDQGCSISNSLAQQGKKEFDLSLQWYLAQSTPDFAHVAQGDIYSHIQS